LNFFSSKNFVKASQTTHHPLPGVSASSGDPLLIEAAYLSVYHPRVAPLSAFGANRSLI
jgi:hypothetical protein